MKKTTQKKFTEKIAKYGAFSLAIAGISNASGQVIFTDVDPDFVGVTGDTFAIDFDGDGTIDGNIIGGAANANFIGASGGNFAGDGVVNPPYVYASNLTAGDLIDGSLNFYNAGDMCYGAYPNNQFCGAVDGYLAVSFDISGNTHFGWVRVNVLDNNNFEVLDFAYEATPDTAIAAGDNALSLEDNTIQGFTSFVDANNILNLNAQSPLNNISIYNINGQEVLSRSLSNTTETIDLNTLSTGVYIARVAVEGIETAIKFVRR